LTQCIATFYFFYSSIPANISPRTRTGFRGRSFSLRHSRFSDLSDEERAAFFWRPSTDAAHFLLDESLRMTGEEEAAFLGLGLGGFGSEGEGSGGEGEELPTSINWATDENPVGRSVVTPPVNQGHCGA
jgi:hypothetical protein